MAGSPANFHDVSDGGISGDHPAQKLPPILVGPSTGSEFNTIHLPLVPVACWKVDDVRFAFDSSFINADLTADDNPNDVRAELAHLQTLMAKHAECPLSIFGHADPVGSDEYNKSLSGRRAMSIYALLTAQGDLSAAVSLWQKIASHEKWGDDQRGQMASFTGLPSSTSSASLIQAYLQKLCPSTLVLSKKNFLAQGADPDGRGDYQGCSEFNPVLLFSQEKQATFDQAKQQNDADGIATRNAANRPNRRVLVLLFRKGSVVLPAKWPCPSALVGQDVCKNRFWSDGETRRSTHLSGVDREFSNTQDTFACRFYQRITAGSPCHHPSSTQISLRLFDPFTVSISEVPYRVTVGGKASETCADAEGYLQLAVAEIPESCLVEWGHAEEDAQSYLYSRTIYLQLTISDGDEETKRRLHNLGYAYEDDAQTNQSAFRRDYGFGETEDLLGILRGWNDDTTQIKKRPEATASST